MLISLAIRNLAIIDSLDLAFGPGLNVLTGETGAGKSIIVGALTLILGGRAGAEMVRSGAERATVDAVFDVTRAPGMMGVLADVGFEAEEGELFLSREVGANGRSSARIGGRPAAVSQLRDIGEWLVDLHGQHEHQSLLAVRRHIDVLDEWGGRDVTALKAEVGRAYRTLQDLERERASLESDTRERARLIDLYTFQIGEITEAGLSPEEEEELRGDARRLSNAQKLAEVAAAAIDGLGGDSRGVLENLAVVSSELDSAAELDTGLMQIAAAVRTARFDLEEAARDLARYQDTIESSPERLEEITDRLELIAGLKRKYGETIPEVLEYAKKTAGQLEALTQSEERGKELDDRILQSRSELVSLSRRLSDQRQILAKEFGDAAQAELRDLAMEKTAFQVQIEPDEIGPRGADRVEFLIAPNPGEPLRPLARIASGGEISRVMLAIKSAMARQDPLPTMVFDEIDAGVGGRTASVIGEKLAALGKIAQILCITHLPQIACRGANHLYIEKHSDGDRTLVSVETLTPESRIDELARMLGGANITETVRRHAREMLNA